MKIILEDVVVNGEKIDSLESTIPNWTTIDDIDFEKWKKRIKRKKRIHEEEL